MPKMRTKKAAAKRFKITGSGKLKRHCSCKSHLQSSKTRKRKRRLRRAWMTAHADHKRIMAMLQ